jgi:NADPH-dependent F420 reductase
MAERQLEVGQAQHRAPRGAAAGILFVLPEVVDKGTKVMKIAVIGAGNVGRALGTGWAKAGHAIVFGVRDVNKPELKSLCGQIGATAALSVDAARQGDIVVLALPWNTAEAAVKSLGDLTGKIVIDTMNPLAMKDGALGLERGFTTSAGETVASWLPGAKVVKTFNQVGAGMMTQGARFETRPVMFLAGDDDAAKSIVSRLVSELGFEPLDAGGLRQARILEPFAMVWINQAVARGFGLEWAFEVLRPKG